ncbi:MAG: hypothetical protein IKN74_07400 [Clostridia bacterium]|nr:hypothetical protein [Clostridia bacterium]
MRKVNSKSKILLLLLCLVMILEMCIPVSTIAADNESANIGDIVYYMPEDNSITILASESGYSNDRTYDNYDSYGMWKVIDKKSDGTLVLTNVYNDTPNVYLQGANGYNNGVSILNRIADELYSDEAQGIKARSINIEDIEGMLNDEFLNSLEQNSSNVSSKTYTDGYTYYPNIYAIENGSKIDGVTGEGLNISEYAEDPIDGYSQATSSLEVKPNYDRWGYYLEDKLKDKKYEPVFRTQEIQIPENYDITNVYNYFSKNIPGFTNEFSKSGFDEFVKYNFARKTFWIASRGTSNDYYYSSGTSTPTAVFGLLDYYREVNMMYLYFSNNGTVSSCSDRLGVILEINPNALEKNDSFWRVKGSETTIIPVVKLEYTTDIIDKINSSTEEAALYEYFYNYFNPIRRMMSYDDALKYANMYGTEFLRNPNIGVFGPKVSLNIGDNIGGPIRTPNGQNTYNYNYGSTIPYYLNYVDEYVLDVMPNDAVFGLYTDIECKNLVATSKTGTVDGEEFPGFYYFDNVPCGSYFVKELEAPSGFLLGKTSLDNKFTDIDQIIIKYGESNIKAMGGVEFYDMGSSGRSATIFGNITELTGGMNEEETLIYSPEKIDGPSMQSLYLPGSALMNYGYVNINRKNFGVFNPVYFFNEKVQMDFYKIESLTGSKLDGAKLAIIDPETNEVVEQEVFKFTRGSTPEKSFKSINLLKESLKEYWNNPVNILENEAPSGANIFQNVGGKGVPADNIMELNPYYYNHYYYVIDSVENGNVNTLAYENGNITSEHFTHMGNILNEYYLDFFGVDVERTTQKLEWVTGDDNNPNTVSYLKEGKEYILRELEAPEGYATAQDIRFKVENGKLVTMTNGILKMSFSHFVDGEEGEYPGAEVRITDANGNVIDTWTTTDTSHEVEGLVDGKAYYYEVLSEEDGIAVPEKILFVAENNKNIPITAEKIMTTIKVVKVDSKTQDPVLNNDFEFGLYSDANCKNLIEKGKANKETGEVTFKAVPFGTYYVKETKAPTGYQLVDTVYTVVVNKDLPEAGKTYTLTVGNTKIEMTLADVETKTNNQLIDAEIQVIDKETKEVVDQWVNTKTVHTIQNLEDGKTYIMKQIKVPDGYYLADDIEFVAGDGEEVVMKNDLILTNVVVKLLDEETKEIIKDGDFEFKLYKDEACTEEAATGTINKDTGTVTFKNLEFGTYYIDQTKIPLNYSRINTDPVKLLVNKDLPDMGGTTKVTVLNRTGKTETPVTPEVVPQTVMPSIVINNNNNNIVTVDGEGNGTTRVVIAGPSDGTVRTTTSGNGTTYTYSDTSSMKYDPDELKGSDTIIYNVPNTESNEHMYFYIAATLLITLGLGIVLYERRKGTKE